MLNADALYTLLGDATPLPVDCGEVCGAACCHSDRGEGMWLIPGEAEPAFGQLTAHDGGRLFVCDGKCDRNARPLACRLFPLFPYLTEEGHLRVVYDPRAYHVCPLVRLNARVRLRRDFVWRVFRVGCALRRDADGRAFLRQQSREIDEWNRFLRLDAERSPLCRR